MDARIKQTESNNTPCDGCDAVGDFEMWWKVELTDDDIWLCLSCGEILGVLLLKDRLLSK